jgi:hypothetical protein
LADSHKIKKEKYSPLLRQHTRLPSLSCVFCTMKCSSPLVFAVFWHIFPKNPMQQQHNPRQITSASTACAVTCQKSIGHLASASQRTATSQTTITIARRRRWSGCWLEMFPLGAEFASAPLACHVHLPARQHRGGSAQRSHRTA